MRSGPSELLRRTIVFLALPAALYLLYATGQRALDSYRYAQQAAELRREIADLRDQNLALQAELNRRRTDAYVEQAAREQLGLVRPGDHQVVLVQPNHATSPAGAPPQPLSRASPPAGPAPARAVWQQWLDFFFGE